MVDDLDALDLAWLRRQGAREPGCKGSVFWTDGSGDIRSVRYLLCQAGLYLTRPDSPPEASEFVPIVALPAPFGGERHWFMCPRCSRRCRIVYRAPSFRCRTCAGAQYRSKYECPAVNLSNARWRLQAKLMTREGELSRDEFPPKPKGMHWRTYHRLRATDAVLSQRWNEWVHMRLKRLRPEVLRQDPFLMDLFQETQARDEPSNV
jgi:hypothetical protein